jgi:phosphodiesterase/alkaline phosphatase D-like protein
MGAPTVYRFEYGASTSYGAQTQMSDPIAADELDHAVSTTLTGLEPGVSYHVRVVAFSINGTTAGPDHSFDVPDRPLIVDNGVAGVTQTKADFSASIRAGFRPTTYRFEYGPTTAYGSTIAGDAGSGNHLRAVAGTASGLQPGTTYHFRVTAINAIGEDVSVDRTFTTGAAAAAPPSNERCRRGFLRRNGKCVKRCKRGFVRRKGKCVKRPRKARKHHGRGKRVQREGSQTNG